MSFDAARKTVLDACLTLADRGYLAGVGGNVALRIDRWHFVVTPSGSDYYAMSPEDLPVLTLTELDVVDGGRAPSVESGLHARVFLERADVFASVHTHQPVASAVALLRRSLPAPDAETARALGPRIETVAYAPSGTSFLVRALGKRLNPDINAYLLANHGLLCVGPTMEAAIARVAMVEQVAGRFLEQALATKPDAPLLTLARAGLAGIRTRTP
jgi:L-fuculose-phosphate aldolase